MDLSRPFTVGPIVQMSMEKLVNVNFGTCNVSPGVQEVRNVPVNYAVRFSRPVTALTARRVRYGVGPDLICQPGPSPGIKTHSSPAAFPTTLSLPLVPFPLSHLSCTAPSCLRPRRAPPTPCQAPSPHRTDGTRSYPELQEWSHTGKPSGDIEGKKEEAFTNVSMLSRRL